MVEAQEKRGLLLVTLATAGYGLAVIFGKFVYGQSVGLVTLLAWRYLCAAALLFCIPGSAAGADR